jgi:hypothetical protein
MQYDAGVLEVARQAYEAGTSEITNAPFSSSFLVFRLNCLHHDARSRLDGGEVAPTGSEEVAGNWTGSTPGCDLPVTMVRPGSKASAPARSYVVGEILGGSRFEDFQRAVWRGGIAGMSRCTSPPVGNTWGWAKERTRQERRVERDIGEERARE